MHQSHPKSGNYVCATHLPMIFNFRPSFLFEMTTGNTEENLYKA